MTLGNLYILKGNRSQDVEIHYLLPVGRITLKAWVLRLVASFLCFCIYVFVILGSIYYFKLCNENGISIRSFVSQFKSQIEFWLFPLLIFVFIAIQSIKRLHDVNKSGTLLFVPFYNVYLLISQGSKGKNNDFGVNPINKIEFFNDLKNIAKTNTRLINPEHIKLDNRIRTVIVIIFFAPVLTKVFKQKDEENETGITIVEEVKGTESIELGGEKETSGPKPSELLNSGPKIVVEKPPKALTKSSSELDKLVQEPTDVASMFEAGKAFYLGSTGDINYKEALKRFRELADNHNHTESQFYLGRMYEKGQGVNKDETEALYWYEKAAKNGDSRANSRIEALLKLQSLN